MNLVRQFVCQDLIDAAMSLYQLHPVKLVSHQNDFEMRFTAGWHIVITALVDNLQVPKVNRTGKLIFYRLLNRHTRILSISDQDKSGWHYPFSDNTKTPSQSARGGDSM